MNNKLIDRKNNQAQPRHGLRLIVSENTLQEKTSEASQAPKSRKPNAFVERMNALANAIDADVAQILKF